MSHELYTALSGAIVQERALEVVADNLANINTPAFKGSRINFNEVLVAQAGVDETTTPRVQVKAHMTRTDFTQGAIVATGRALDVAMSGPGFFSVHTPDGERLTRNGSFVQAPDGVLRDGEGHVVMGNNGPIAARADLPLKIDAQGQVFSDDLYVDTLKRQHAQHPEHLTRQGEHLWQASDDAAMKKNTLPLQIESLEQSNVNAVSAMTEVVRLQRQYQMQHQAMQTIRSLQQRATNALG